MILGYRFQLQHLAIFNPSVMNPESGGCPLREQREENCVSQQLGITLHNFWAAESPRASEKLNLLRAAATGGLSELPRAGFNTVLSVS